MGLAATGVHFGMLIVLASYLKIAPLWANPLAFMIGFTVSFSGHYYWTFAATQLLSSMIRFLGVALMNLVMNQVLFTILLTYAGLAYYYAQAIVLIIMPIIVYIMSRFWAFR